MEFHFIKNSGYQWEYLEQDAFKGYFQYENNEKPYRGKEALEELVRVMDMDSLTSLLRRIDGVFAFALKRGDTTLFAVDRARSMPLYYSADGKALSDSSEALRQQLGIKKEAVDPLYLIEFAASSYVTGSDTVYAEIKQLEGGCAAVCSADGIKSAPYYLHFARQYLGNDKDDIKQKLTQAAERAVRRALAVAGDRPIVMSMSGGYDSRLVGCMLKRCGAKNVSCYTYGNPNAYEAQQSKKNAEALGFRWYCVVHTEERMLDILGEAGKGYFDYCCGHDYTIYLQNFIAVNYLQSIGWFEPNSVFITGLCGDMPSGEYITPADEMKEARFDEAAVQKLYDIHYPRFRIDEPYRTQLKEKICRSVRALGMDVHDYQSFWSVVDAIYTLSEHSRAFLHMNRVHEFFGYEWLIPLWDKDYLNLWYAIPAELRANQAMYEEWLLECVYKDYGLNTRKVVKVLARTPIMQRVKRTVGGAVAFVALHANIRLRRKTDLYDFSALEGPLFQRLQYKGHIIYKRAGLMQLLIRYIMEQRYGTEAVKMAMKHLK